MFGHADPLVDSLDIICHLLIITYIYVPKHTHFDNLLIHCSCILLFAPYTAQASPNRQYNVM